VAKNISTYNLLCLLGAVCGVCALLCVSKSVQNEEGNIYEHLRDLLFRVM
jgi:hypothetical protein